MTVGRAELERRSDGGFVGVVDAGEAGDLAGSGLGVEALRIASFALLDRGVDEDLVERQPGLGVGAPRSGPGRLRTGLMIGTIATTPGFGHQLGHRTGPPDVLGPVGRGETEVGVEPVAQVVAVEHHARPPGGEQLAFDLERDRRLARGGETR